MKKVNKMKKVKNMNKRKKKRKKINKINKPSDWLGTVCHHKFTAVTIPVNLFVDTPFSCKEMLLDLWGPFGSPNKGPNVRTS